MTEHLSLSGSKRYIPILPPINSRPVMKRGENGYMEHSQVDFQLDISILWVQKKVYFHLFCNSNVIQDGHLRHLPHPEQIEPKQQP